MEKVQPRQAKPMAIWCLLVFALVAIFVAIGAALFFMPGHGPTLERNNAPAVLGK
jgi:hypothetical protein